MKPKTYTLTLTRQSDKATATEQATFNPKTYEGLKEDWFYESIPAVCRRLFVKLGVTIDQYLDRCCRTDMVSSLWHESRMDVYPDVVLTHYVIKCR